MFDGWDIANASAAGWSLCGILYFAEKEKWSDVAFMAAFAVLNALMIFV